LLKNKDVFLRVTCNQYIKPIFFTPKFDQIMLSYFRKNALIACLSIVCANFIAAQTNSLRVQDPQQTWRSGQARIETASFDVRPRGLYAEVSLNMTYSAQGTSYIAATDTLEIQHYFTLPANALVTDSWLWVDNQIVYAKLIDRWTASTIYEGIVKRRQDPSILFKNQATGYEYRIFPMAGNKTRRVQLHFMMPVDWQSGIATIELPTNLLRFGNRLPTATVRIFNNAQWKNPRLTDFIAQTLTVASDSTTNQAIAVTGLTATQINNASNVRVSFDSPMKNGVFVSTYKQGRDSFYQMAIQPDQFLNLNTPPRKLIFAVDYNANSTSLTAADLIANLKQNLRSTLLPRDSFNLIFSRLLPTPLSNRWISAANLETTLAQITEASLSSFSNLPNVLAKSIEFTKLNNGGDISLMSNDASVSSLNTANALIADLKSTFPVLPIINVLDYNTSGVYFWLNGTYYYGNDYFYNILTSQTGGNFTNAPAYSADVKPFILQHFRGLTPYFENFETYTTLTNGFCHSRFNIGSGGTAFYNKPILQVGKFNGQTPFQVEVTGAYQGVPFGKRVSIADSLLSPSDSTVRQMWAGAQILTWEAQIPKDNATIKRILETSQSNLVLSIYTAFLALEPGMGGDTCRACRNNATGQTTATKEPTNDSFRLVALPNPFKERTVLRVSFPAFKVGQKADLTVYNLVGKAIQRFNLDIKTGDTSAEATWEAQDAPSGVYLVRFSSGSIVKTLKIVKTE
jgi:hypothetical protein